ncbi:MAG: hypothetical protein KAJ17_09895, partial [Candidatus Krumholzibacteria bacterium]|nr:hypothetical protein [Candidatus Krumholzibacteria bacterium]
LAAGSAYPWRRSRTRVREELHSLTQLKPPTYNQTRLLTAADSDGHRSAGLGRFLCHKTALAVGLIASLPMVFYATSGLETHAELVFILLGAILHLEARTGNDPRQYFASQCSFLAVALIRPEGVLFLILGAAFVVFGRLRGAGDGRRSAWVAVIVPLVIYIIFFSLKASYYG